MRICLFIITVNATTTGRKITCSNHTIRIMINASQMPVLEAAFASNCYPNKATRIQLAQQTGLSEKRVRGWYVCRRKQTRRKIKEGNLSNFGKDNTSTVEIMYIKGSYIIKRRFGKDNN